MKAFPAAAAVFLCFAGPTAANQSKLDLARADVQAFVAEMQREHGIDPQDTVWILRDAVPQPKIIEIMQRPAESTLAWWQYRERFLTEDRINGGVRIWREHSEVLERVARETGVPPQYLVAITGVETSYGRITGTYRVLDALTTLAFDYPRRADYFRRELGQFLLLAREEGLDPRAPKGSYAGAMGIAQFMPSSFRAYAADGSGDGRRDLWTWNPDVFASIANYFVQHGWKRDEPVLAEARHAAAPDDPAAAQAVLNDTVAGLRARGYAFTTSQGAEAPAMLVPATQRDGVEWRVGFQNFYTITRYNRSLLYGMAIHDLAQAIAERYESTQRARTAGPHPAAAVP